MAGFETVQFDLTLNDPDYGTPLQANIYHVDGIRNVDGTPRDLSIGQLVMAICLQRASELEMTIIKQMNKMSVVTGQLEALTEMQAQFVGRNEISDNPWKEPVIFDWPELGQQKITKDADAIAFLEQIKCIKTEDVDKLTVDDIVQAISAEMDSLNSVNQKDLIELQSMTSKRDQSYDLITNVLKSFNTVMTGVVNNY